MASLDELEGEAVEITVLVLLVILAVLIFLAWKGGASIGAALKQFWNFLSSLFTSQPVAGGAGRIATVHTGSSLESSPFSTSDYQSSLDNLLASGGIDLTDYENASAWAKTQGG